MLSIEISTTRVKFTQPRLLSCFICFWGLGTLYVHAGSLAQVGDRLLRRVEGPEVPAVDGDGVAEAEEEEEGAWQGVTLEAAHNDERSSE